MPFARYLLNHQLTILILLDATVFMPIESADALIRLLIDACSDTYVHESVCISVHEFTDVYECIAIPRRS